MAGVFPGGAEVVAGGIMFFGEFKRNFCGLYLGQAYGFENEAE